MKHLRTLAAAGGAFAFSMALGAAQALADAPTLQPAGGTIDNGTTGSADFKTLLGSVGVRVLDIVFLIAGILAVLYLVYNGIQYITSAGNPDKIKAARSGVINAVIGIIIIAAAYYIINFAIGLSKTANAEVTGTSQGTLQ